MNQILVTKKLYVTPELRRKKKLYKLQFFFCVFLACMLFSYYIYAEYDRSRSEEVSQEILEGITQARADNIKSDTSKVDNTIKRTDNILVVALDDNDEEPEIVRLVEETPTSNNASTVNYTTDDGTNYTTEAIVRVARLGIDYPVLSDTSESLLKISVNKYWGPKPNTIGNYCVVGHNYKNKTMFGRLSEIVSGDIIELETAGTHEVVKYSVYDKYTVEPTDTSCTSQLTNGRKEVTLITCTNYGKQRLVVKAREVR